MPGVRSSNPGDACALQLFEQRLHLEAQHQVEHRRAELHQQVALAGAAHAQRRRAFADGRQFEQRSDGIVGARAARLRRRGWKRTLVARAQLPDLPQLGVDDGDRADEAAEAGAIGPEDHRHVAGEVDAADGVGVVVDVGRMQSGLAAIGARPRGLRADQPHAGAAGVVVHFPFGVEERARCRRREEIRRAVRAVGDADLPGVRVVGPLARRDARGSRRASRPLAVSRSTSPARSARPPWPPNCPSVNVERLPRYSGTSKLPRTAR